VLIDAAAAGLPSVATSLPGSTDYIVKDGESGLLFPPGDVEALASAVDRLVSDASLRARMGEAARARSREFGFEGYVRCLRAFYVDVTGRAA
jgi:glycosyltransferase involved in cell wall biosynthesis